MCLNVDNISNMDRLLPLVSIVVPVYNGETFLEKCLQSIIRQSYTNIEIIIVNDGSTDNTSLIIDRYVDLDKRIIGLKQKNEGPALARKKGLEIAKGKYVQYLDSDDCLHEKAIEYLLDKAEATNADIVVAPFRFCYLDGTFCMSSSFDFSSMSGIDYLKQILNNKAYWSVWSKFHKRELLLGIPMEVYPDICFGEDVIWSAQLLIRSKKVVSIKYVVLDYNTRDFSLSHSCSFDDGKFANFEFYRSWLELYLTQKGVIDFMKKDLAFFHIRNTFQKITWRKIRDLKKDMTRIIHDLKCFPDLRQTMSKRELRVVSTYRFSILWGNLRLRYYIRKGKM